MRLIVLLFTVLHLLASTGISLQKHYCLGEVRSVHFLSFAKAVCKCPVEWQSMNGNCCRSEVQYLKVKELANAIDSVQAPQMVQLLFGEVYTSSEGHSSLRSIDTGWSAQTAFPPPNLYALYILFCSLITYG